MLLVSPRSATMLRVVNLPSRTDRATCRSLFGKRLEVPVTTGTIKKVVADRGFGFIAAEDAKEYFFHRGGLDSSLDFDRLTGGERVEFEIEASAKGPRANRVRSA
ncbi:MAG: cold shock domain-containing protein [Chloroflexota bacterium]|nr:MAG: cold shock domain-containing protein [Chloroflexota bacterium]